jgi:type I restriction enzyme S subunit
MTNELVLNGLDQVSADAEMPEGWAAATLEDIGDLYCGQSPATRFVNTKRVGTPYITGPGQWDGNDLHVDKWTSDPRRIVPDGCVFVTVKGAGVGTIFPGVPGAIGRDIYAFSPAVEVHNSFVRRALEFTVSEIKRNAAGDIPGLSKDHLLKHHINIPPCEEQKRIVAAIDNLFVVSKSARDHLSRVPVILKRFRQAVLAAACSGRLTEDWRAEHQNIGTGHDLLSEIEKVREEKGAKEGRHHIGIAGHSSKNDIENDVLFSRDLPQSWIRCRVDQIATVCLGGTPSRKESSYWDGEVSWVSSGEVANCRINSTRERITQKGLATSNAKVYPKGTVLIAMIGEGKTRGQAAVLETDASTNQNVAALVFGAGNVCADYVWYWALSEYEKNRAVGRGGAQPALNGEKIRALTLPLPPLEEQGEIVRRIEGLFRVAETVEHHVCAATVRANRLTQSILAKAFRGELVPTEAELARREGREYEPASVLLERIQAERATHPKTPAVSKRKLRKASAHV